MDDELLARRINQRLERMGNRKATKIMLGHLARWAVFGHQAPDSWLIEQLCPEYKIEE